MNRDPLWNEIRTCLQQGGFDALMFERCAEDLLRAIYPNLVPVVGGSDSGMDGAIASPEGAFPLVCTTGDNVIGNFTKNIKQHLDARGGPRRCVIATSTFLTPQRRRNILNKARELDVTVEQIHDGEDFVGRLYVNDKWRLELLGITGSPPALSVYPPRLRQTATPPLVGREEDLQWLQGSKSDLLLVGQPGSGKTYLHQHWALTAGVFFAVSDDPTLLANAIRSQKPEVVVIDDAHVHLEQIDLLRRLRLQVGATYRIHANCWPDSESAVAARLDVGPEQIRHLKLVPRKQMADLIESLGIVGPDVLLALLLNQAKGKPGLCVALVEACKREGAERIWTGEALAEYLLSHAALLQNEVDQEILARFALGGDSGVVASRVASTMNIPLAQLRGRVAALEAGGVVAEVNTNVLAVMRASLRAVLVRDVFFKGPVRPDILPALADCPSQREATHVLIAAAQRGASIDRDLIRSRVIDADDPRLWEHYSYLAEWAARDVIENHPEKVCQAGEGLLAHVPELAIPALIRADEAGVVKNEGNTNHPNRLITEWISPWDREDESVPRRSILLGALESLCRLTPTIGDDTALKYAAAVIDPGVNSFGPSPVDRYTVVHRSGVHSESTLKSIAALWPRVLKLLPEGSSPAWAKFFTTISNWAWPTRHTDKIQEGSAQFMRQTAATMLADLLVAPGCNRARRHRIRQISDYANLGLSVPKDDLFDVIFCEHDRAESWENHQKKREEMFQKLSESLAKKPVRDASEMLGALEHEAANASLNAGWDRSQLYWLLARKVDDPAEWIDSFVQWQLSAELIYPFVEETRTRLPAEFPQVMNRLLSIDAYRELAVRFILAYSDIADGLVDRVLGELRALEGNNEFRFRYDQIPVPIMLRLLHHTDPAIRTGAAMGEWHLSPNHEVRPELLEIWKRVIIEAEPRHEQSFDEIFTAFPDIGFQWACKRITHAKYDLWKYRHTIAILAPKLSADQRRELLFHMTESAGFDKEWFDAVVGDDWDLFGAWVAQQSDDYVRTLPLTRKPSARWERLATVAMDNGVSPEELVRVVGVWGEGWSGPASAHNQGYVDAYAALLQHEDKRFHPIARHGLAWAKARVEEAKRREEADAV